MRTIRTITVAAVTLVAAALPTVGSAQDTTVDVVDNAFESDQITIAPGGTVQWSQSGSNPHTVTASDGSFDSHPDCPGGTCMGTGDTFEQTFDEPGTYTYYCKIHGTPDGGGMAGTIVVEAAATESPSPTETASPTDAPVTGSITVSDQSGDGTTVTVDEATIAGSDGFIVVHADDGGAPGAVIGHAPIEEGTSTDVSVTFDEALTQDQTVWPMLHVDAGTAGTYEFPGADVPVSVDDQIVVKPLAYTVTAQDTGTDDTADDTLAETGADVPVGLVVAALGAMVLGGGALLATRRARVTNVTR